MNNLVLFLNSFMSYLLVFAVFVIAVIAAVLIGKRLRIRKDAKLAVEAANAEKENGRTE